eukprot:scaffold2522_cov242-Pinguiococcus_pyrenoidosus.AAC.4
MVGDFDFGFDEGIAKLAAGGRARAKGFKSAEVMLETYDFDEDDFEDADDFDDSWAWVDTGEESSATGYVEYLDDEEDFDEGIDGDHDSYHHDDPQFLSADGDDRGGTPSKHLAQECGKHCCEEDRIGKGLQGENAVKRRSVAKQGREQPLPPPSVRWIPQVRSAGIGYQICHIQKTMAVQNSPLRTEGLESESTMVGSVPLVGRRGSAAQRRSRRTD